ncbi:MAG TPA: DinB family protein [Candidatus Eisenbacteria bacterium]|nr:DinB family protein [Candidatus Eisenbacteria bacterium]
MIPWIERRFPFEEPVEMWPVLVERVRGTPARIEDRIRDVPREWLVRRDGERWSIQEHIGHLVDLDHLHDGRLDDYLAGAPRLRPADMTNRRTWEAGHHLREIDDLLAEVRRVRGALVERLDAWDPAARAMTAQHPRLERPMRLVDMVRFVAEHDDHHLASIGTLIRSLDAVGKH